MFLQSFEECRQTPEKHPSVPLIVSRRHVLLGSFERGFLCEAPYWIDRRSIRADGRLHPLDVAESGLWMGWWNSQDHHASWFFRHVQRDAHNFPVRSSVLDRKSVV